MDETRFYQRPLFLLLFPPFLIVLLYYFTRPAGFGNTYYLIEILLLLSLYFALILFWLAFFSQFVLPVNTFADRQKIFDRVFAYIFGGHGPAIFFRDGEPVKSDREEERIGPGVLWLDSASGVVTRTASAYKNTFGPGVHFTDRFEQIAGYVDLHIQNDRIGPRGDEDTFTTKSDVEDYAGILTRRRETTALTRDGIEVVPNIGVTFKIDADPVTNSSMPGSRFGYDESVVRLAVQGQPINPDMPKDSPLYHIPWNQLPALLAADAWRDLVSKFTLNDLFDRRFILPPSIPNLPPPIRDDDTTRVSIVVQGPLANTLTIVFREINRSLSRLSSWIESHCNPDYRIVTEEKPTTRYKEPPKEERVTGLQLINFLVKERLQKQQVSRLNQFGNPELGQTEPGSEYNFLRSRGIRVFSAGVSNLRFAPEVENKWLEQWTATWLIRAQDENWRLDQEEGYQRLLNEGNALKDYIIQLSYDLIFQKNKGRAGDLPETLRALMLESRVALIRETQLFRQSSPEREEIEDIIQWLEKRI